MDGTQHDDEIGAPGVLYRQRPPDHSFDFTGKVVLVTGAGGILGMGVAQTFLSAGAKLTCVDRFADRLQQTFTDPEHALVMSIDLNDEVSAASMVEETIRRFGRLDVLANTVGGFRAGTPVHETPLDTWDFMLNLNARTAFVASRAVVPAMLRQGSGVIIHTAARPGLAGRAGQAAYSASKASVIRLVESLAAELADSGVRANCILPGTIDTPMNRQEMPDADHSRWVKPESIARVMLFLASEAGRDINGAAIPVYGRS